MRKSSMLLGLLAIAAPLAEQVNAIIDSAQRGLDKAENNPTLLTQGRSDPLAEATKLARQYGLNVCGQG